MTEQTEHLTAAQLAGVTEQLRNTVTTIETEQEAPLDLDQTCTIYDLCVHFGVGPFSVLSQQGLDLIDPGPPIVEVLAGEPKLLAELGKAMMI